MSKLTIKQMVDRKITVLAGVKIQIEGSTDPKPRYLKNGKRDMRGLVRTEKMIPTRNHPWFKSPIGRARVELPKGFTPIV